MDESDIGKNPTVVWISKDKQYIVVYDEAIFCHGFNVYKNLNDSDIWEKFNPRLQFFTNLKGATKWLKQRGIS